jgi:hypothetical protein
MKKSREIKGTRGQLKKTLKRVRVPPGRRRYSVLIFRQRKTMTPDGVSTDIQKELHDSPPDKDGELGRLDQYFDCFSGSTLYEAIERASAKKKRYLIRQLECHELREVEYRTREKIQRIKTDLRTKQIHGTGDRESQKNARAALARFKDCLRYVQEQRRIEDDKSLGLEMARLFLEEASEKLSKETFASVLKGAMSRKHKPMRMMGEGEVSHRDIRNPNEGEEGT